MSEPSRGPDLGQNASGVEIPFSIFGSAEAHKAWQCRGDWKAALATWCKANATRAAMSKDEAFWHWFREEGDRRALEPLVAAQHTRYDVDIEPIMLNGVAAIRVVPKLRALKGDAPILINLHGGAFMGGDGPGLLVGAIPAAAESGLDVISIDYRLAPAHRHPDALDDVAAVYDALLKRTRAGLIGVYGCSAGAMLVAQLIARLAGSGRPMPGAVAMLCGTGELFSRGDSAFYWAMLNGLPLDQAELRKENRAYLKDADESDPCLFPMRHDAILAQFPPSFLVSGSRSYEMSTMIDAHNRLSLAGVESHLHLWDGVTHGFVHNTELPEARQTIALMAAFFKRYLGKL